VPHGITQESNWAMSGSASIVDRLLNEDCLRALALSADERLLDVGCGFGELTCALAGGMGRVLGIEAVASIVDSARTAARERGVADRVEFRVGDAYRLPLEADEWGTFDVAHARFLLESLGDPCAAVMQMVRAVRPGGRIVLTDDDHETLRLWPEAPRVMVLWRAYMNFFDAGGNDSIVGRKLVAFLFECGAEPVRSASFTFGTSVGEPSFTAGVARLRSIFETEHEGILATGLVDEEGFRAGLDELETWAERPDATAWNVVRWAEGRRPLG